MNKNIQRDSHFVKFARLLHNDLQAVTRAGLDNNWNNLDVEYKQRQIIAQRAHDFLRTACSAISEEQLRQGVRLHPRAMLRAVPDMSVWSEEEEEEKDEQQ